MTNIREPPKVGTPLRVLIVEDSEDDARLLLRELRKGGFDTSFVRVQTAEAMSEALERDAWDIVLSDYSMPNFTALGALSVLHASGYDIPFIMMSGTVDEEAAVEALRAGANDFVVKGRMARLAPAIARELREANERRERNRAERAAEAALQERLRSDAATEAKNTFFASVTHELRTPLTGILGFAELLEQRIAGDLTPKQETYVANVLESGRHLLRLINDILDLSKIEAGRMELRLDATSFPEVVASVRAALEPLLHGFIVVESIPDGLPRLSADRTRLQQILFNLLSNAIKFTPRGGQITIEAAAVDDNLRFSVRDTGVGIPPEALHRIFEEFEQVEPGTRLAAEGTGLGLSITRRLVTLHGGTIAATTRPEGGTTFTVTLPFGRPDLHQGAPRASHPSEASSPAAEPVRAPILVVEDDSPSAQLFQAILEARGHTVILAATIGEARERLRSTTPRLVVCDIGVPGGGGLSLLAEIRATPHLKNIPMIATTAAGEQSEKQRLLVAGFDAYAGKPLDSKEFCKVVDSVLVARAPV